LKIKLNLHFIVRPFASKISIVTHLPVISNACTASHEASTFVSNQWRA